MAQQVNTSTGAPGGAAHPKVFPPLDPSTFPSQLVWLALTFGALYVILSRVALPRIGEVIEERRERIERDLEQAGNFKAETEKVLASHERALAEARAKGKAIAKAVQDDVTAEIGKERARADAQIALKLADAEFRIAQAKSTALTNLSEIVADTATAILAKLLDREVSTDEVRKALMKRAAE